MKANASTLKRTIKAAGGERAYVAEVDGRAWIGTPHFAVTIGDAATELLGSVNLTPDPGMIAVNGSITRTGQDAPNLAPIVAENCNAPEVDHAQLCGRRIVVDVQGTDCYVIGTDEAASYVPRAQLDVIATELAGVDRLSQVGPLKPLIVDGPKGRGICMPIRAK
jgi:hypothetical protein